MVITSEQVGVFMALTEPGARAAGAGWRRRAGRPDHRVRWTCWGWRTTVCAPEDGVIERLLAHDGEVVEYGQALAELRRSADAG